MNRKYPWLAVFGVLLLCTTFAHSQVLPPTPVAMNEFPDLSYPLAGPVFKLPSTWSYRDNDDPKYSGKDYDDTDWEKLEITNPKTGGGWRWYRTTFDLPAEMENHNLLLDLGRVSVYDEVFVNGVQVGRFGNPPPNFLQGASNVWRKYPIAAERFTRGRNVLAIRVSVGYRGGLYEGPYTLQALADDSVVGKMNLKTSGADALEILLTESSFHNTFSPGSKLLVGPDVTQFFGAARSGRLTAEIVDEGNEILERATVDLSLNSMQWARSLFRFSAPAKPGNYRCRVSCLIDGKTVWDQNLPFHVKTPDLTQFNLSVDSSLEKFGDKVLPVQVSSAAMGHFGPREVGPNLELFDNLGESDARSGMAYSAQVVRQAGAPRLFLANTRRVPEAANKVGRIHRAAGYGYDGLNDAWIYGYVRPNRADVTEKMSVKSTSWAKRTYRYEYRNKDWMEFSISAISPAWQVKSNAEKVRVFDEIGKHGIGLPTHLAYESKSGVKIVDAETGIRGRDMSANWVLAWFNGAKNWNEFDTPYLFVLEKCPELVETYGAAALFFNNSTGVGTIQGMPLYGVTLQQPDQTAAWSKNLPTSVLERCRYWSRVLVNAPDEVKRTAEIDYDADQLTVKDEFTYLDIRDEWQTQGLKIAPLSPVFSLAATSGNLDIAVSKTAKDLEMATLQGPLLAAESTENILFRVKGVLHYIREVRAVTPANDPQTRHVQAELNRIVADGLEKELEHHPWEKTVSGGELVPGRGRMTYSNLLLTLPYLEPALRHQVEQEIQAETEKYFLYSDIPDAKLAEKLEPPYKETPVVPIVTNPVSGLKIGTSPAALTRFGIDQTYFSSLNIYMIWQYADTFKRYGWVKQQYPILKNYFNATRNSHDWAICESWDTFSGFRVGNGLQEGGGIYAGMVGMARIAKELGEQATADTAAYHAVMQIVGLQGQLAASDYLKQRRPWLSSNSKGDDIEYVQKIRSHYFAELNEFAGLSQAIIGIRNSASSPGGYIESPLPETMRLYQEIWPKFTDDFYDPKYDRIIGSDRRVDNRISMDAFVYQITNYPQSVQQVFDVRKQLELDWWSKLPDYRAYLDSRGKIGYRKLW